MFDRLAMSQTLLLVKQLKQCFLRQAKCFEYFKSLRNKLPNCLYNANLKVKCLTKAIWLFGQGLRREGTGQSILVQTSGRIISMERIIENKFVLLLHVHRSKLRQVLQISRAQLLNTNGIFKESLMVFSLKMIQRNYPLSKEIVHYFVDAKQRGKCNKLAEKQKILGLSRRKYPR